MIELSEKGKTNWFQITSVSSIDINTFSNLIISPRIHRKTDRFWEKKNIFFKQAYNHIQNSVHFYNVPKISFNLKLHKFIAVY